MVDPLVSAWAVPAEFDSRAMVVAVSIGMWPGNVGMRFDASLDLASAKQLAAELAQAISAVEAAAIPRAA